jgi:hypothetical protein
LPECAPIEIRSVGVGCVAPQWLRKPVEFNGWALEPIFYFRAAFCGGSTDFVATP